MAREIHEREDLLRDANALEPRLQLRLQAGGNLIEVFVGFRAEGAPSLYFDTDPVYHFNSGKELRRAFVDDCLYKAQRGKLVAMQPLRGPERTDFLSHELRQDEELRFGQVLLQWLDMLRTIVSSGEYELVGQVPEDADGLPRLVDWLAEFAGLQIADTPRVG